MKKREQSGFTVVELLISVGIIILLLGVIFFFVSNSRAKAADARTQETLANIRTIAVEERVASSGSSGYTGVCSSEKVRDVIYTLAQQLETIDYACVASAGEFAVAFPLKAQDGYWCVDSDGASKEVDGLPTVSLPHSCDHIAPSDGTGGPIDDGGDTGGGPDGEGDPGPGDPGDGGGANQSPIISLQSGSFSGGGATQMCSGAYCAVFPTSATEDTMAFVSATDAEDGTIAVQETGQEFVYTSSIPSDGPGIGQKTIDGIGVFEGCEVSSKRVTYGATDSAGATAAATRTFLICDGIAATDSQAPTVSLSAPAEGAELSGSIDVSASAADNVGVAGVSFYYGISAETATNAIGEEDTSYPYQASWDTAIVTDGAYVILATARDVAGNSATSAAVSVTVANSVGPAARKPLLFSSGFEGTSGTYLSGFESPTQSCCAHSLAQSVLLSREGAASLRAEVRSNDPMVSGGWRAEVLPVGVEDIGDRWYGWSIYFDTPQAAGLWTGNYGGQYVHWNSNAAGGSKLSWTWSDRYWDLATDPDLAGADHYGPGGPTRITAGTWHDIVVHANWGTGLLEAWLDGALFFSAPAGSGLIDEDPGQYFKFGMVRWGDGAGGAPTGSKWVMYYDSLRIGDGATGVGYYDVAPGDY